MIGTHEVNAYPQGDTPTGTPVDLSCLVDDVAIRYGRGDTQSQPEASSATVNVTVGPGAPLPTVVDIGSWLVITTELGGTTYTRFSGRITDLAIGWDDAGESTPEQGVGQIVAVGILADFARRIVGDEPWPQELDGARVARIFDLAGYPLNPATSDPGTVNVIPRDVDARAALEVAHGSADSAGGLIWATRDGEIRYADSEHRRGTTVALDLDVCDILVTPTWLRNLAGLVNDVSVTYGEEPVDPPEGESSERPVYRKTNDASQGVWGRYEYSVTVELADLDDVTAAVELLLVQNGSPVWMLQALPLDVAGLTLAETQTLLGLEMHSLIRVGGLPETGPTPTNIAAWVEGWDERLAWGVHELTLVVSDYCRTAPPPRWNDVPASQTWDMTRASLTWDSAVCMGPPSNLGTWDTQPASTRWDMVDPALTWDAASEGVSRRALVTT